MNQLALLFFIIAWLSTLLVIQGFSPRISSARKWNSRSPTSIGQDGVHQELKMGLFDFFKPKKSASASHILVKGSDAKPFLIELKGKLSSNKDVPRAFAQAASQYSSCPSSRKGGSLGTFQQGQMVPAFDKVVFNEQVGVIHGPISTPFGEHLILIESRED